MLPTETLKQLAIDAGFCLDSTGFVQTYNSYGVVEESVLQDFAALLLKYFGETNGSNSS